jgi:hypothetical protein
VTTGQVLDWILHLKFCYFGHDGIWALVFVFFFFKNFIKIFNFIAMFVDTPLSQVYT